MILLLCTPYPCVGKSIIKEKLKSVTIGCRCQCPILLPIKSFITAQRLLNDESLMGLNVEIRFMWIIISDFNDDLLA